MKPKPCPFCGAELVWDEKAEWWEHPVTWIECPLMRKTLLEVWIPTWNRRPVEERLARALQELMIWGVELDDERLRYITVQVDRECVDEARAALRDAGYGEDD